MATLNINENTVMSELMAAYPGARRALFKGFHVGGCQSCGFAETDTITDVATKHDKDAQAMVTYIQEAHARESALWISPQGALATFRNGSEARLIDLRSPEEFAAAHIDGAEPISESFAEEIMTWPKDSRIILYCQDGQGSMNAAAYMSDYGFTQVQCVDGGYPALVAASEEG